MSAEIKTVPGPENLNVGSVLRHKTKLHVAVLARRKDDSEPWPGWWCLGGGGLADFVIAEHWEYLGEIGLHGKIATVAWANARFGED